MSSRFESPLAIDSDLGLNNDRRHRDRRFGRFRRRGAGAGGGAAGVGTAVAGNGVGTSTGPGAGTGAHTGVGNGNFNITGAPVSSGANHKPVSTAQTVPSTTVTPATPGVITTTGVEEREPSMQV